jgi:hypothetical protein
VLGELLNQTKAVNKEYFEIFSVNNISQLNLHFCATLISTTPEKRNTIQPKRFFGWAMIDSGTSSCFIHRKLVEQFKLPTLKKEFPRKLKVIDGREISSGLVDTECRFECKIGAHKEILECNVVDIGPHDIVLGMSWLKKHSRHIDWANKKVFFNSDFCIKNCLSVSAAVFSDQEGKLAVVEGIPDEFVEFTDVFLEDKVTELPPHRPYNLEIKLEEGAKLKWGPIYSLKPKEDKELCKTIDSQLAQGLIRKSKSPMASPILFVPKKNGKMHMCVDYRALNTMTVKNWYPLPLTNDLIEKLQGAKIFSKLDLKSGYNLVRIKEGDEWKTAFRTKYGLFEYLVMPFGLANAPAAFQHFMNDIFRDLLDIYVVVYLDNILIFSKTHEEHILHVRKVLKRLKENHLYCQLEKCSFFLPEVDYLGIIASGGGICVDPSKVAQAVDWPVPRNVKNVQEFLGFANFYR